MARIFVKQGNATIQVSDQLEKMVNRLLDANPIVKKTMMQEVERVYQHAVKEWPVRVISPRTAEQKKKATFEAIKRSKGAVDAIKIVSSLEAAGRFTTDPEPRISPRSQDSKGKLQRGLLLQNGELIAYVRCMAPYAFAIRTGQHTLNNLPFGTRTVTELISKPMRKEGRKLAAKIAKEMIKKSKR